MVFNFKMLIKGSGGKHLTLGGGQIKVLSPLCIKGETDSERASASSGFLHTLNFSNLQLL